MPTNRTKRKHTYGGKNSLSWDQEEHFELGYCLLYNPAYGKNQFPFRSEAERRELWEKYKDELLEKCKPGERPTAWYQYEKGLDKKFLKYDHGVEFKFLKEQGWLNEGEEKAYHTFVENERIARYAH